MAIYPGGKEVSSYLGYNSFKIKAEGDLPPNANIKWTFTDGMVIEGKVSQYKEIQRRFCEPGEFGVTCELEGLNDQKFLEIDDGGIKTRLLNGVLNVDDFLVLYDNGDWYWDMDDDLYQLEFVCIKEDLEKESSRMVFKIDRKDLLPSELNDTFDITHRLKNIDIFKCKNTPRSFYCLSHIEKDSNDGVVDIINSLVINRITINEDWTDYIISGGKELKYNGESLRKIYRHIESVSHTDDSVFVTALKDSSGYGNVCFVFDIDNHDNVRLLIDGNSDEAIYTVSDGKTAITTYYEKSSDNIGYYINEDRVSPDENIPCSFFLVKINSDLYMFNWETYNDYGYLINIENKQLTQINVIHNFDTDSYYVDGGSIPVYIENNGLFGHIGGYKSLMVTDDWGDDEEVFCMSSKWVFSFDLTSWKMTVSPKEDPAPGQVELTSRVLKNITNNKGYSSYSVFKYNNFNCYMVTFEYGGIPDSMDTGYSESSIYIPYRSEE